MAVHNAGALEAADPVREALAGIDELLVHQSPDLSRTVARELQRVRILLAAALASGSRRPASTEAAEHRTPGIEERRHPRIKYPPFVGPRLVLGTEECEVTDCSVEGLRFRQREQFLLEPGSRITGCVHFWSGNTVTVSGIVVRVEDGFGVLHLVDMPIPDCVIDAEERFLRLNYPPETYRRWRISAQVGAEV